MHDLADRICGRFTSKFIRYNSKQLETDKCLFLESWWTAYWVLLATKK